MQEVTLKSEANAPDEFSKYMSRTNSRFWYVLDTESELPDDWRFIGSSARYEYNGGLGDDVNWLVTPGNDSRVPSIPQFYMTNHFGDAGVKLELDKFFQSYGLIHLTFLNIHRARVTENQANIIG